MKKSDLSVKITPVILAGGVGDRLWPLSRKSFPKQFSRLIGNTSLFEKCVARLQSSGIVQFNEPVIFTATKYRFIVGEQLNRCSVDHAEIFIEPKGRNTGPAVLAASLNAYKRDPEAIMLVSPCDQIINDISLFHRAIQKGLAEIKKKKIVTFGIVPTNPETGYGYLEVSREKSSNASKLSRFIEKPSLSIAKEMLKKGNYLWNSGMLLFKARDMISEFSFYAPHYIELVNKAFEMGVKDLDFFRLDPNFWEKCGNISIDNLILERSKNLVAIPLIGGWSDLGSWASVMNEMKINSEGVALSDNAHSIDCNNTLLRSEHETLEIIGIGLTDIVAIATPDAVLVAHKNATQRVRDAVSKLRDKKVLQAENFPLVHRPWGSFERLALGNRFQVKRIVVKPGKSLSLQSHHHRSEHWVVVSGTAKVTLSGKEQMLSEGESVYISLGSIHRLENPGKLDVVLIEVQTGGYLGEDDIIRYEDKYSRI